MFQNFYLFTLLLLFSCLSLGCSQEAELPNEVQPYLDNFLTESKARGRDINTQGLVIQFGDLKEDVAGYCLVVVQPWETPEIIIDTTVWNDETWEDNANNLRRELIIFHELGHCLLGLDHQKSGIMNEEPSLYEYTHNRASLLDDLFFMEPKPPEPPDSRNKKNL